MAFKTVISGAALGAMMFSLAACGGAAGDGGTETPESEPAPPVIEERQTNFKAMGDAFKAIRTQLESDSPDMAAITQAAGELNAAALKVEGGFPEGTSVDDGFDTEALATIWEKPEQFAEAHKMLTDATAEMVTIAEGGDASAVGAQVGAIGKSCKNCHDNFRLETD